MKNEPIIAYNHLQDEEEQSAAGGHQFHEKAHKGWKVMMHPVALIVEVAAVVTLLILMIEEILH